MEVNTTEPSPSVRVPCLLDTHNIWHDGIHHNDTKHSTKEMQQSAHRCLIPSVVILSVTCFSVKLNVIMLSVNMLNVIALTLWVLIQYKQ